MMILVDKNKYDETMNILEILKLKVTGGETKILCNI